MSGRRKFLLLFIGAFALTLVGRFFLNSPIANIQLAAETVGNDIFGRWNLTNSIIGAWIAMGVIVLMVVLAMRKQSLVPRGLYNLVEATIGWLLGIVEGIAGRENGRKFFPLIATIFVFIVIANWTALTPVFGTIGKVETAEFFVAEGLEDAIGEVRGTASEAVKHDLEEYEEELEHWLDSHEHELFLEGDTSGAVRPPLPASEETLAALITKVRGDVGNKRLFIFNGDSGARLVPVGFGKVKEIELDEYWDFERWQHMSVTRDSSTLLSDENEVDIEGKTVGLLLPYLRSMNTDLMNTLAFSLIAMTMITVWGIQANGFFGYAGRFINVREGPIGAFLGILELIGEFAKIISFSFRLLGNMFAGEILIFSLLFLLPVMAGVFVFPFLLEVFVGFIQAVVFAILTLIFAVLAVTPHGGHSEDGHGGASGH